MLHAQIIEYLNAYVERFSFRQHLVFRTEVTSVLQLRSGRYLVITKVACCCHSLNAWLPETPADGRSTSGMHDGV